MTVVVTAPYFFSLAAMQFHPMFFMIKYKVLWENFAQANEVVLDLVSCFKGE